MPCYPFVMIPFSESPSSSLGSLKLNVRALNLTDDQLLRLAAENPETRFEIDAQGNLIIMTPTGGKSGWRSGQLFQRLAVWAEQHGSGLMFDSSTGFRLPNGALR